MSAAPSGKRARADTSLPPLGPFWLSDNRRSDLRAERVVLAGLVALAISVAGLVALALIGALT